MALRIQRPSIEGWFLYQDRGENDRYFTTIVYLGKHESEWAECSPEAKKSWEDEHRHPESESASEQTEEPAAQPIE